MVFQQANSLETKATTLLGFAGLLLGLLFSSDLAAAHWNGLLTLGVALLGSALLPLGATLYPSELNANPALDELISGGRSRKPPEIESLVATSLQRSIEAAARVIRVKSQLVRGGSILIAIAVAVVASRFVYILEAETPQSPPSISTSLACIYL